MIDSIIDVKVVEDTCDCDKLALIIGEKVLDAMKGSETEDLKSIKVTVSFDTFLSAEKI